MLSLGTVLREFSMLCSEISTRKGPNFDRVGGTCSHGTGMMHRSAGVKGVALSRCTRVGFCSSLGGGKMIGKIAISECWLGHGDAGRAPRGVMHLYIDQVDDAASLDGRNNENWLRVMC